MYPINLLIAEDEGDSPNQRNQREQKFGGYFEFAISGGQSIVDFITIEGKRIYFKIHDPEESFETISKQYRYLFGKPFPLNYLIPELKSKKLLQFTSTHKKRAKLQNTINSMLLDAEQSLYNMHSSKKQNQYNWILQPEYVQLNGQYQTCTIIPIFCEDFDQHIKIPVNNYSTFDSIRKKIQQITKNKKQLSSIQDRCGRIYQRKDWQTPFQLLSLHSLTFLFIYSNQILQLYDWPEQKLIGLPEQFLQKQVYLYEKQSKKEVAKKQYYNVMRSNNEDQPQQKKYQLKQLKQLKLFEPMQQKSIFQQPKQFQLMQKNRKWLQNSQASLLKQQQGQATQNWCQILQGTKILCTDRNKNIVECEIEDERFKANKLRLVSYNEQTGQIYFEGNLVELRKRQEKSSLVYITFLDQQGQEINLITTPKTKLKVGGQYKSAQQIKMGQQLLVFNKQKLKLAQVKQIHQLSQSKNVIYTIQVAPHHNFFANGILTHNHNANYLTVYFFNKYRVTSKRVRYFADHRLDSMDQFKDMILTLGETELDKSMTFGDYRLNEFSTVFAFKKYIRKSSKFVVTQQNSYNITLSQLQSDKDLSQHIKNNFTGIIDGKIVDLDGSFEQFIKDTPTHMLVSRKIYLSKIHYHHNFQRYQQDISYLKYKLKIRLPLSYQSHLFQWNKQYKSQLLPLYLYTMPGYYRMLNQFLRQKANGIKTSRQAYFQKKKKLSEQQYYFFINAINKCLDELPSLKQQQNIVYRGVSNIQIENAFLPEKSKDNQKFMIFNGFTSTSRKKNIAQSFISDKQNGILITIKTITGKSIQQFSKFQHQAEVLIKPYTYFLIKSYNLYIKPQTMQLQEIPFPMTNKPKLIFWVDDNPENNKRLILKYFSYKDLEVVQVRSTRMMKILLSDFFGYFNILKKKIVIISDLARLQDGVWNYYAGVQLFELIYSKYGMSSKAFIYTMSEQYKQEAIKKIKELKIPKKDWTVSTAFNEILHDVQKLLQLD